MFLSFLSRHFNLVAFTPQATNIVVFDDYFVEVLAAAPCEAPRRATALLYPSRAGSRPAAPPPPLEASSTGGSRRGVFGPGGAVHAEPRRLPDGLLAPCQRPPQHHVLPQRAWLPRHSGCGRGAGRLPLRAPERPLRRLLRAQAARPRCAGSGGVACGGSSGLAVRSGVRERPACSCGGLCRVHRARVPCDASGAAAACGP